MSENEELLQEHQNIYEILVDLFYLKDPLQSFKEENRQYLKTVCFGVTQDKTLYEERNNNLEPLMPLKWYLEYNNYYEAKYAHIEEYRNMVNEDDEFKRYYTNIKITNQNIKQIVNKIRQDIDNIVKNQCINQSQDPDSGLLKYSNNFLFLDYKQRHQLEQQEPFLYGNYHIQKVSGCEHTESGCQIYCDQCKKYFWCNQCHDSMIFEDHKLEYKNVKQIICMNCKKVQEPAEKCIECGQKFTNFWCPKCKILQLFDLETNPVFHCQIHDKCHVNMSQKLHKQCSKCGQCIAAHEKNHFCEGIQCIVCMSDILPSDDRMVLKCNPQHQMHESCWYNYLNQIMQSGQGTILCPVCRQDVTPSVSNQLHLQTNLTLQCGYNKFMFQRTFMHFIKYIDLACFKCQKCNYQFLWMMQDNCPQCYSNQLKIDYTIRQSVSDIEKILKNQKFERQNQILNNFYKYIYENKDGLTKNLYDSFLNKNTKYVKQYGLASYCEATDQYIDINQNYKNQNQFNKIIKQFQNVNEQLEQDEDEEQFEEDEQQQILELLNQNNMNINDLMQLLQQNQDLQQLAQFQEEFEEFEEE